MEGVERLNRQAVDACRTWTLVPDDIAFIRIEAFLPGNVRHDRIGVDGELNGRIRSIVLLIGKVVTGLRATGQSRVDEARGCGNTGARANSAGSEIGKEEFR